MELAAELGRAQPGRLIMAAISAVFTIGYVANSARRGRRLAASTCRSTCSPKTAAFGSTGSARTECPPSPETASKTCARSSPMSVPPAADRPPSRQSKPPCGAHRMLTLLGPAPPILAVPSFMAANFTLRVSMKLSESFTLMGRYIPPSTARTNETRIFVA